MRAAAVDQQGQGVMTMLNDGRADIVHGGAPPSGPRQHRWSRREQKLVPNVRPRFPRLPTPPAE